MPRQATRLVLGRSAEAKLTSRLRPRPFSTGPRLRADDDGDRRPPPNRRERSVTAASALGAMSRSSEPSSRPLLRFSNFPNRADVVRPPARLGTGRPNNVLSLKSLPGRTDGAPQNRSPQLSAGVKYRTIIGSQSTGSAPRFTNRPSGTSMGPRAGGARSPSGFVGGQRFGGAGRLGGGRPGGRPGAGAGRGSRKPGNRGGARDKGKSRKEQEKDESAPIPLSETQQAYMRDTEMGVDVPYKPSMSPNSLVGWGPAVATNTSTGLHEIAVRNMRILAGGRPHSEGEQTFDHTDMKRWLGAGKPIYFSSIEQKEGMVKTLQGSRKDPKPIFETKIFQGLVASLKKEHGDDYGAFVKAFNTKFNPVAIRQRMDAAHETKVQRALTGRSDTVKEAIAKYAVKGEHPTIQYAEDTYSRLASYHARGSTYRPADAAKFDAKMKTLVAS